MSKDASELESTKKLKGTKNIGARYILIFKQHYHQSFLYFVCKSRCPFLQIYHHNLSVCIKKKVCMGSTFGCQKGYTVHTCFIFRFANHRRHNPRSLCMTKKIVFAMIRSLLALLLLPTTTIFPPEIDFEAPPFLPALELDTLKMNCFASLNPPVSLDAKGSSPRRDSLLWPLLFLSRRSRSGARSHYPLAEASAPPCFCSFSNTPTRVGPL